MWERVFQYFPVQKHEAGKNKGFLIQFGTIGSLYFKKITKLSPAAHHSGHPQIQALVEERQAGKGGPGKLAPLWAELMLQNRDGQTY